MGYQEDQRLPSERADNGQMRSSPPAYTPLPPPRVSSEELRITANIESLDISDHLTQEEPRFNRSQFTWTSRDPRNASTESLLPEVNPDGKRKLLLIYVHGFMGNETSFQSFPAHVHSLVRDLMVETHIVHTKIYPRYRSRRAIEFARDEFSDWLQPHESPDTDVILLGHSMGGILSAEVVLKPSNPPHKRPLFNKVLGTINFDVPFLGMHPGVVISGLGSLFRKEDSTQDDGFKSPSPNQVMMPMPAGQFDLGQSPNNSALLSKTSSQTNSTSFVDSDRASRSVSQLSVPVDDPNYNPRFENDVVRPVRKGWESAFHFMTKHSGNLWQATQTYVTSHVEFGGTMADYPKLYARYKRVRALEDVKDARNSTSGPPRVRFVNFYTASTGLPKSAPSSTRGRQLGPNDEQQPGREQSISSTATSTRIVRSIENSDNILASIETNESDPIEPIGPSSDQKDEDQPTDVSQEGANTSGHSFTQAQEGEEKEGLPPIPPVPTQPTDFDQTHYQDKDILKLAQKDHARQTKAYQSALKNREKAITERKKLLEKRTKKAAKELEKASKEREKATKEKEKARLIKSQTLSPSSTVSKDNAEDKDGEKKTEKEREKSRKPARDRKFCITPSKQNGIRDATWIRVFMTGVDEVGAHCGLFFAEREHYEGLIQTVAELVREWVLNDMSVRLR